MIFHKATATTFFDYNETFKGNVKNLKEEMYRERYFWIMIPLLVGLSAGGVLILAPLIDSFGSFDFHKTNFLVNNNLPFAYGSYPFSIEGGCLHCIAIFGQLSSGFIISSVIGAGGFLFIVMSQNLVLEMRVLLDSLENIEIRARSSYELKNKCESEVVPLQYNEALLNIYADCLKKNFLHHQVILRYFKYWTNVFSLPVLSAYTTGTIVIALSLLSAGSWVELPGTTIASMVLCAAEVGYMYLFSYFSQLITDLNDELHLKIYETQWYLCDERIKRSMRIFQVRTLRPMTLVAGGLIPANMDTFAKVMNSAYSYYNLVNAFNEISD